jgi:hypothetical protein
LLFTLDPLDERSCSERPQLHLPTSCETLIDRHKGNGWALINQQDCRFAFFRDHDDTLEAHYACLERPCACIEGWVFVGYIDEDGEEREASYRCRRCANSR